MNLIKPGAGCNISVSQTLDFTETNNIVFTVVQENKELIKGNVVTIAKWLCTAANSKEINIPSKFVITFANMALHSIS